MLARKPPRLWIVNTISFAECEWNPVVCSDWSFRVQQVFSRLLIFPNEHLRECREWSSSLEYYVSEFSVTFSIYHIYTSPLAKKLNFFITTSTNIYMLVRKTYLYILYIFYSRILLHVLCLHNIVFVLSSKVINSLKQKWGDQRQTAYVSF